MSITNGYCTLAELKTELGITTATAAIDARLELAVESASRLVDAFCDRRFWVDSAAVAKYYTADSTTEVKMDSVSTLTGLIVRTDDDEDGVYETTWTINDDFRVEPINAAADGLPWTRLTALPSGSRRFPTGDVAIEVTSKGGWPAVPSPVKHATLTQASRLFKRKDSPYGISGSPELQGELRLLSSLDPDVQVLLRPYRKWWAVV